MPKISVGFESRHIFDISQDNNSKDNYEKNQLNKSQ